MLKYIFILQDHQTPEFDPPFFKCYSQNHISPAHVAAGHGHVRILKILKERRFNLDTSDHVIHFNSTFHLADFISFIGWLSTSFAYFYVYRVG